VKLRALKKTYSGLERWSCVASNVNAAYSSLAVRPPGRVKWRFIADAMNFWASGS